MIIEVWWVGKTTDELIERNIGIYQSRIQRLCPVRWVTLPDLKKVATLPADLKKSREADMILTKIQPDDYVVLLDENGRQYSSRQYAEWVEQKLSAPGKRLILLIGGVFGFDDRMYQRANDTLSLSTMTFTHEMVRLILAEQLYRALTLIHNIKYHY